MTSFSNLDSANLAKLSLKSYFKILESVLTKDISLNELTDFFSSEPYSESKPYLTRRRLIPSDNRFKSVELIYKDPKKVDAIVYDIRVTLSELVDIFGDPIVDNEPYSDSTAFAFRSENPFIEIIKTRYPKCLTKLEGKDVFEYEDHFNKIELMDPEFNFIQFDIQLY